VPCLSIRLGQFHLTVFSWCLKAGEHACLLSITTACYNNRLPPYHTTPELFGREERRRREGYAYARLARGAARRNRRTGCRHALLLLGEHAMKNRSAAGRCCAASVLPGLHAAGGGSRRDGPPPCLASPDLSICLGG